MKLPAPCKLAQATLLVVISATAHAAEWSDTYIGYARSNRFKEPGRNMALTKDVVSLAHVSGYSLGTNFFNVEMLLSDDNNRANNSARRAHEVYVVYGNTLSFGKLRKAPVAFGPVRDVGLHVGFDFSSKNDAFGGAVFKLLVGPKLDFDVPGLLQVALLRKREWGNNSISGMDVRYDDTWRLAANWRFDFQLGLPAVFKGWGTYTARMGRDGFGNQTAPETWIEPSLLWDVGAAAGKEKVFYAGLGYQYIRNKFSNNGSIPGTRVSAPMVKLEAHF
ncbi:MAG TPA: outer envelope protein [Ramlibacter sp.]|nr:outer envelope protein [Ramlibacter sp.]